MPFNTTLLNPRDIVVIGLIAVTFRILFSRVYRAIEGK